MAEICKRCDEPAMENGSGLCEPHFEAQQRALKERYDVPVAKVSGTGAGANEKPAGPLRRPIGGLTIFAVLFAFVWVFYISEPGQQRQQARDATNFQHAAVGEVWRIGGEDVALLSRPEVPESAGHMMGLLVALVDPGARVVITDSSSHRGFKGVTLIEHPSEPSGWILVDTVRQAERR